MKNYGKKVLSVLLALLMCLTVVALDFSGLTAGAYTASPTHTYKLRVTQTSHDGNYDGQEGGGTCTVYGKDKNGTGSQSQIWSGGIGTGWATTDGGSTDICTLTSDKWPSRIYIGCNICNNNSMFYGTQNVNAKIEIAVQDAATGNYGGWQTVGSFTLTSNTVSGGGGSAFKSKTFDLNSTGIPAATKVATSNSEAAGATTTYNVTLNITGGANKTQSMNAYVYDQYNVIWTAAPSSWSKDGTVACTTSLSTTGASESCTLTMGPTNSTYQKSAVTVTAKYGSLVHYFKFNITPTYKINFNVSANGGTSTAPGAASQTNTNTGSVNTSYTIASDKTASKVKSDTGTWTFEGWNGSSSATSGTKAGSAITIDNYNDTLYAIFSRSATANFYWYNSSGSRVSSTNNKTVYNNATSFTFDVPKSSVPTSFVANNTTYTFAGWAVDSTTKTTADHAATVTTATRNINTGSTYNFYALYTGSVTLSYDNNGGSGLPAAQTASLTLNCGANTSAASNTSGKAEFTLNPANVEMSRSYSSAFIGWKTAKTDANGVDAETANYKDATVTWSASSSLPNKITINQNTTVYAAYYDFRYNVKFYDNTGAELSTQTIRHNFSATAPTMKTDSSDPAITDANSHYVFDHWEYTDGAQYKDTDKLTKLVNGYTYKVYAKYVGHKHIWGDPYNIQGAITCTTGQTYKMKCTVCGFVRDFETESLGHDFQITGVSEPTCTRPGSYGKKICVNCGAPDATYAVMIDGVETVITDANRSIPALGHNYPDTPATVEATCTTAGYTYYECARCGNIERASNIPALGHDWVTVEPIEATCTVGGHTGYTKCSRCGLFLEGEDKATEALGHEYVLVEETASTCTEAGHYAYYECSRCGKFFKLEGETYTDISDDLTVMDKPLAEHDYQLVDQVLATCTEPGYTGAMLCSVCHALKPGTTPGSETPALGHVWERADFEGFATYADVYGEEYVEEYVSEQPCVDPCSIIYTCPVCGETYTMTDDPADHNAVYHGPNDATCTEPGNIEYWTCEVCGKYFSDEACTNEITAADVVTATIPHTLVTIDGQAPTCTEDGIPDCYKCTVCEKLFVDAQGKTELTGDLGIIEKLGHNWTPWVISKQPTDDEDGEKTHRCLRCDLVETEDIPADGHDMTFFEAVAATCTTAGNNAYYLCANCGRYYEDEGGETELDYTADVFVAPLGHNIDEENPTETVAATCAAEGYNSFVCSRCGYTVIETIPKIAEHGEAIPYGENVPATCAAPGQTAGTMCSICGAVLTQPTSIAKLAHTPEAERRDVRDATCIATGYTGDLYCDVCGQIIQSGTTIEKTAHQYGDWVIVEATCTEYGSKTRTCAICGDEIEIELPVLGHQVVTDKAKAATCDTAGITAGTHCSRCGAVLTAQQEIPMLGHSYTAVVVAPTCTKIGYTEYTCGHCGDVYRDTYTEKLAHVAGTPATCTEPAVCANCGRSFGDALGHDFMMVNDATVPATCIATGSYLYKCTRCGETYTETIPLAKHHYDLDTLTPHFTSCTEPGYYTIQCSVCGYVYREDAEAPGHNYVNGVCTQCGQAEPTTPDTPATPTSEKCPKCGLNHNGRTGLWKQDGLFCRIIAFFRSIFKFGK